MPVSTPRAAERPSAQRTIPVRRLDVDLRTVDVDRWIVPDDPIFSHFIATLSAVFPPGEEFFVKTVREHRAVAEDDPVLKAQVKGFIGQEAMHGREHRQLNARLAELGYYTHQTEKAFEKVAEKALKYRMRKVPLAMTAAAEHLTGIFAEVALGHEPSRELLFSHPDIQTLVTWHALEELEHKNVAFDVLQRTGAGYFTRAAGFVLLHTVFARAVIVSWIRARVRDREMIGWKGRKVFNRHLRQQRLLSLWALRRVFSYLRPGFHPDDTDTEDLVREWRERLAGQVTETASLRRPA